MADVENIYAQCILGNQAKKWAWPSPKIEYSATYGDNPEKERTQEPKNSRKKESLQKQRVPELVSGTNYWQLKINMVCT